MSNAQFSKKDHKTYKEIKKHAHSKEENKSPEVNYKETHASGLLDRFKSNCLKSAQGAKENTGKELKEIRKMINEQISTKG